PLLPHTGAMSDAPAPRPRACRLSALARQAGLVLFGDDLLVTGLTADSRHVRPGDLFVAVPGAHHDGRRFVDAAVAAGAAAVCTTIPVEGVPTLVAAEPRAALADLAAAFYDYPVREVALVGITGSLGKTSTALLTQACLAGGGVRVGVIGSLGVRARGAVHDTGMTTPDALVTQQELRWMADEGVAFAVMEVSSHGILLERVRGLELALGVFTNLVPDEHLEFHPTPEHYVETKLRFLRLLRPDAPVVYNADDDGVRGAMHARHTGPAVGVTLRDHADGAVRVRDVHPHAAGSDFTLVVERALETIVGGVVRPDAHALRVPLLGRQQVGNAALAATAALLAGVPAADVAAGMARLAPIRRRMEVVHPGAPLVVDDTVGNPRSIELVRQTVAELPHRALRIAYAVRGARGATINEHNAEALAAFVSGSGARLVVTTSDEAADARNRVTAEERDAALGVLRARGVPFTFRPRLADAVHEALDGAGPDDLVLLLGAQGMDAGAAIAREALGGATSATTTDAAPMAGAATGTAVDGR
ncbi:MAG TPA: Mur ligase family protein, partial [Gemmatimonadaceae bacterium]|nr:Mur ligase family protein [Gemmatimonadaceae bacterium]